MCGERKKIPYVMSSTALLPVPSPTTPPLLLPPPDDVSIICGVKDVKEKGKWRMDN